MHEILTLLKEHPGPWRFEQEENGYIRDAKGNIVQKGPVWTTSDALRFLAISTLPDQLTLLEWIERTYHEDSCDDLQTFLDEILTRITGIWEKTSLSPAEETLAPPKAPTESAEAALLSAFREILPQVGVHHERRKRFEIQERGREAIGRFEAEKHVQRPPAFGSPSDMDRIQKVCANLARAEQRSVILALSKLAEARKAEVDALREINTLLETILSQAAATPSGP